MYSLGLENCAKLGKNTPALNPAEIRDLMLMVQDWQLMDQNGIPSISKTFKFTSYLDGLRFANLVGLQAEEQDHHPAILTEWRRVTVTWQTHAAAGLHRNDFIMAARTDMIYESQFKT